jgi:hypothetical protein
LTASFNALQQIFNGAKMLVLSENGPIPDPGQMQAQGARWLYFMTWNGFENDTAQPEVARRWQWLVGGSGA